MFVFCLGTFVTFGLRFRPQLCRGEKIHRFQGFTNFQVYFLDSRSTQFTKRMKKMALFGTTLISICRSSHRAFIFMSVETTIYITRHGSHQWHDKEIIHEGIHTETENSEGLHHISSLHSGKVCPCSLYSISKMKVRLSSLILA